MNKILTIIFFVLLVTVLAVSIVIVFPVYHQYREKTKEVNYLKAQYEIHDTEFKNIQQEIHDLEHDPAAITALAREKFNYQYPNETVIFFNK